MTIARTIIVLAISQLCLGETYYLDPVDGNDHNTGLVGHPWKTIDRAYPYVKTCSNGNGWWSGAFKSAAYTNEVQQGDTVKLLSGDYGFCVWVVPATFIYSGSSSYITYQVESGCLAKFQMISVSTTGGNPVCIWFDGSLGLQNQSFAWGDRTVTSRYGLFSGLKQYLPFATRLNNLAGSGVNANNTANINYATFCFYSANSKYIKLTYAHLKGRGMEDWQQHGVGFLDCRFVTIDHVVLDDCYQGSSLRGTDMTITNCDWSDCRDDILGAMDMKRFTIQDSNFHESKHMISGDVKGGTVTGTFTEGSTIWQYRTDVHKYVKGRVCYGSTDWQNDPCYPLRKKDSAHNLRFMLLEDYTDQNTVDGAGFKVADPTYDIYQCTTRDANNATATVTGAKYELGYSSDGFDAPHCDIMFIGSDSSGLNWNVERSGNKLHLVNCSRPLYHTNTDPVQFTTTGTLPSPLATATKYYVVDANEDDKTFSLATTEAGDVITLSDAGTGTHTIAFWTNNSARNDTVLIERCQFYNHRVWETAPSYAICIRNTVNCTVRNCLVFGYVASETACAFNCGGKNFTFVNNTVVNDTVQSSLSLMSTGLYPPFSNGGVVVKNNIFARPIYIKDGEEDANHWNITNNVTAYHSVDSGTQYAATLAYLNANNIELTH